MGEVVSRNYPYTGHAFDYENFSTQQKCINNLLTLKEKKHKISVNFIKIEIY